MDRFKSKPLSVEAVQFFSKNKPWPLFVDAENMEYGSGNRTKLFPVLRLQSGEKTSIDDGDWIVYFKNGSRGVYTNGYFVSAFEKESI